MDGERLQALQYKGHRIAAKNIGLAYDVFRPSSASNPMDASNQVLTGFKAFFTPHNAANFGFGKPMDSREPLCHIGCDATQIQVGDILDGPQGPYVVLSKDHIMPPLGVQTNRIISVLRDDPRAMCGLGEYGGTTATNEVALLTGWPASVLEGGKGKVGILPGDPGASTGWQIMFAAYDGILIDYGDIIADDLGRRYGVRSAELSHTGWRIQASEMVI